MMTLLSRLKLSINQSFPDKRWEVPRRWSNKELRKVAHLMTGSVVNVSAWKDEDKEGESYKDYFCNASSYSITNYKADARGFQEGQVDQKFLDLRVDLDSELIDSYEVVFNHTTLEHIFEVEKAFSNLCHLSSRYCIVVVPFLQLQHGEYGDFWRFTPNAIERLFRKNSMNLMYINWNSGFGESVYVFAVASKRSDDKSLFNKIHGNMAFKLDSQPGTGSNAQQPFSILPRIIRKIASLL